MLKFGKRATSALFCEFSSSWHPNSALFSRYGFQFPEDFEHAESIGEARIQIIDDFSSGVCLYNHGGVLYPITEKKIIERSFKIKEAVVVERFGTRTPFRKSNVYFLDIGYNFGSVEYMAFKYHKDQSSFTRYREVLYQFPLSTLSCAVLSLKELHVKGHSLNDLEKREKEEIINRQELKGWKFMERNTSPSEDEYVERCELPLYHYYFQHSEGMDAQVRFEYFQD